MRFVEVALQLSGFLSLIGILIAAAQSRYQHHSMAHDQHNQSYDYRCRADGLRDIDAARGGDLDAQKFEEKADNSVSDHIKQHKIALLEAIPVTQPDKNQHATRQ